MVDVARFFLEFVQEESCGKCVPCRVGTKRMLEILNRICDGHGEEADVERLIELGEMIKDTSLCGLGQTAPNPVLSTIRHFGHEYVEHIRDKHCRAGVCPALVYAPCSSACPANVDIPGYVSLVAEKRYAEALRLHRERNPFAAVCSRVCFHTCEDKCRRSTLDAPVSIRGIKRFMVDQEVTIQLPEVRENEQNAQAEDRHRGRRPGGPVLRLLPGPAGLSAEGVRGRAAARRHAGAGHSRLPPAARNRRPRSPHDRAHGRGNRSRTWRWARTSRSSRCGPRATTPCSWASARRWASGWASPATTPKASPTPSPSCAPTTSAARCRWARTWS